MTARPVTLYNTLTRQKDVFEPLEPGRVRMYTCGPTVYRYVHVGNLRSYLLADLLRRTLLYNGYQVTHVKNITDVGHMRQEMLERGEDKMLLAAQEERKSPDEIAEHYARAFFRDEARLNILPADVFPRATQHIPEMIALVERLFERGVAYESGDNVYFDVGKFPEYGRLSGNRLGEMLEGVRVEVDEAKRHPEDFTLWKAAEPGRLMAWDSPWGRGFPGWHIECSAMSTKYLGEQFDLHTGGIDNVFPHHEDEIAQTEAATGKPFVRYWVHGEHLLMTGRKMAKSADNIATLDELEAQGIDVLALRYLCCTAHYRTKLNFSWESLASAQAALQNLRRQVASWGEPGRIGCAGYEERFLDAINDDLNLPRALAVVWELAKDSELPPAAKARTIRQFDRVLGLDLAKATTEAEAPADSAFAEQVESLLRQRTEARQARDWTRADQIRDELAAIGVEVRDTPAGPEWTRKSAPSLADQGLPQR